MPRPKTVTKDGRCPYCNADFTDTSIDGTYLFWNANEWGRGMMLADEETGELAYSAWSATSSDVSHFECGACGNKLRLRKGTEEEWS